MASIYIKLPLESGTISGTPPSGSVAVTSSALPNGASTAANQAITNNKLDTLHADLVASNTKADTTNSILVDANSELVNHTSLLSSINSKLSSTTQNQVYNEVLSVPSSVPTTIVSYTATQNCKLKRIAASGTNVAMYSVTVNGLVVDKAYTSFGAPLSHSFEYAYALVNGDVVVVSVMHERSSLGNFNSKIVVEI